MSNIIRDDGTWNADPSGLISGDLDSWRERMHQACPDPKVGDIIIITNEKSGKKYGYRAQTAEGFDTRWQRVSSETVKKHLRMLDVKEGDTLINPDDYEYLCDGVYVHKDDAWF